MNNNSEIDQRPSSTSKRRSFEQRKRPKTAQQADRTHIIHQIRILLTEQISRLQVEESILEQVLRLQQDYHQNDEQDTEE